MSLGSVGFCPGCNQRITRDDERYEIERYGPDDPEYGTSVAYHVDCAPFGATNVPDELDKANRRRDRGRELRQEIAEGPDE